jgi:MoxR-like ATPase
MKLKIKYPSAAEELEILKRMGSEKNITINRVLNSITIDQLRKAAEAITVDERIEKYIVSIVTASRAVDQKHLSFARYIEYGASPRATIYLYRCARVRALFEGRTFVLPEDVKAVAYDVLRHRIVLSYEAQAEELSTDDVIKDILAAVSVP